MGLRSDLDAWPARGAKLGLVLGIDWIAVLWRGEARAAHIGGVGANRLLGDRAHLCVAPHESRRDLANVRGAKDAQRMGSFRRL